MKFSDSRLISATGCRTNILPRERPIEAQEPVEPILPRATVSVNCTEIEPLHAWVSGTPKVTLEESLERGIGRGGRWWWGWIQGRMVGLDLRREEGDAEFRGWGLLSLLLFHGYRGFSLLDSSTAGFVDPSRVVPTPQSRCWWGSTTRREFEIEIMGRSVDNVLVPW